MRSYTLLQLQIAQKILYEKSTLISTKKILYLAVEWVVLLLQPYPFLIDIKFQTANSYDDYPINYPVNDILAIASFSRIYILVRAALILTPYMSNRCNWLDMQQIDFVKCMDAGLITPIRSNVSLKTILWHL